MENLLMRHVRQGDISFRIQDVILALVQDVLAEAHATHRILWQYVAVPRLRDEGVALNELEHRFIAHADQAKDFAYGLAEQIKQSQKTQK